MKGHESVKSANTTDNPISTEPDWDAIRRDFPTTEKYIYLDIARKAILPRQVENAFHAWINDVYDGAGMDAFSMANIEITRRKVADLFGASPHNIALIKNTSEGINIIAQGFPFESGDNVVISEFEHQANIFPWRHLRSKGVEIRWARPDAQGRVTLDCYRPLVNDRTRILSAAWVAYGNGFRTDILAISEFCRKRGIKLVVDGIQAVGVLSIPLKELGADVLVAGGHKAQFSTAGAGFMYASEDIIPMITPPYASKFSFTSDDKMQEDPVLAKDAHRFEYGNPNFLGIWIQSHSADYLKKIGLANIEARVKKLTTYLLNRAEEKEISVVTPRDWNERAGIVGLKTKNPAAIVEKLKDQNIIVSARDSYLRASVHFYNTKDELDRYLDAVKT